MAAAHAICCIRAMRRVADYDPEDLLCPVDPGGRERGISDDVAFAGPFGGDVLHPLLAPGGEPCRQDQAQVATAEGRWATRASAVRRPGGFPVCKGCGGGCGTFSWCSGPAALAPSNASPPSCGLPGGPRRLRQAGPRAGLYFP